MCGGGCEWDSFRLGRGHGQLGQSSKQGEMISEAVDAALLTIQEELAAKARRLSAEGAFLEIRLMEFVAGLDMNRRPKETLKALTLTMVVYGYIVGNMKRVTHAQHPAVGKAGHVSGLFFSLCPTRCSG